MASGVLIKVGIGAFVVWASSQMGALATELLGRARLSVQATELATVDNQLAAWSVGSAFEKRRGGAPATQRAFERTVSELFTQRGKRRAFEDRWGSPYLYERLSDRPPGWRISSRGPDKQAGTKDDLVLERHGDTVHLNTDPAAIAEGAAARKRQHDQQVLAELRRLTGAAQAKADGGKAGAKPAKVTPVVGDLPAAERAKLEKALAQRSLADLDVFLKE